MTPFALRGDQPTLESMFPVTVDLTDILAAGCTRALRQDTLLAATITPVHNMFTHSRPQTVSILPQVRSQLVIAVFDMPNLAPARNPCRRCSQCRLHHTVS